MERAVKLVLVGTCLFLSFVCFWTAPQQLSRVGFAARNREPDYLAYYLSVFAGIVSLLNLILIISSKGSRGLYIAFVITIGLLLLSIYLFFASW